VKPSNLIFRNNMACLVKVGNKANPKERRRLRHLQKILLENLVRAIDERLLLSARASLWKAVEKRQKCYCERAAL
jgi:hypothetical protein